MDIQIVYLNDILPLTAARFLPSIVPRTVELIGPDFSSVISVEFNNVLSPSFMMLDQQTLLAEFPQAQLGFSLIQSIVVLSSNVTRTNQSRLRYKILGNGMFTKKVSGILSLIQLFVKLLLTTPGRDVFARGGGGLLTAIRANVGRQNASDLLLSMGIAVSQVRSQIISAQAGDRSILPDERLVGATVDSAGLDPSTLTVSTTITIQSAAGVALAATMEL